MNSLGLACKWSMAHLAIKCCVFCKYAHICRYILQSHSNSCCCITGGVHDALWKINYYFIIKHINAITQTDGQTHLITWWNTIIACNRKPLSILCRHNKHNIHCMFSAVVTFACDCTGNYLHAITVAVRDFMPFWNVK